MLSVGEIRKFISLNTRLEEVPIGSYLEYYLNFNEYKFSISENGFFSDNDSMHFFENISELKDYLFSKNIPLISNKVEQLSLL